MVQHTQQDQLRHEDERWMRLALDEARRAAQLGEVPVGAVVTRGGELLAATHNRRELDLDPTAHAEMLAMRLAAGRLGAWRLTGCVLYVTIEPCPMCAGAAVLARLARVVYGASDPKAGACGTLMDLVRDPRLNHQIEVVPGVLAAECGEVMREFFDGRRTERRGG
ncbi:MAG: tRNA adenosine(34) deaminase TadA [Bacillota bacterium]|nr:tRNA adenosine(34) deaminase TadA [Bacillota bacterium]